ncbi:MAG TPA: hypothetical protein VFY18_12975 [Candidatus Limnocylindrales bacterium]|nr:hypothetical protein [Candidatus Limnocylindrales bacterium]
MIASVLRGGLRLVSIATAAMAIWLVWVVLFVLPGRDPEHILLWALVAAGSAVLVAGSLLATRRAGTAFLAALTFLSVGAVAFGLLVIWSFMTAAIGDDSEGYLLLIGVIPTAHGILGLTWVGATTVASRRAAPPLGPTRR